MTDTIGETATKHVHFEQDPSHPGLFLLQLDGVEIRKKVSEVHISAVDGDLPRVVLVLSKSVDPTEFEGLARVAVGEPPEPLDPGPAAAVFIGAIDPEELEKAALVRPDLGGEPYDLTRAMLAQLTEWANGRS